MTYFIEHCQYDKLMNGDYTGDASMKQSEKHFHIYLISTISGKFVDVI